MRERDSQCQVKTKVDHPPGLPLEPGPDRADGSDTGDDHEDQPDGGGEHARVRVDKHIQLMGKSCLGHLGIADGGQDGMGDEQAYRPRPQPAVPAKEPILAEDPLHERQAAHEQDHDQCQVGPDKPGEVTEERHPATRGNQGAPGLCGERQADRCPKAEPDQD